MISLVTMAAMIGLAIGGAAYLTLKDK